MSRRQVASSSAQPSLTDNVYSWLGSVFDRIIDSPVDPYPRYSAPKRAAVGSPLPPGGYVASTPPLPSSAGRATVFSTSTENNDGDFPDVSQQHNFPAQRVVQPGTTSRDSLRADEATPPTVGDEVPAAAPSEQCAHSSVRRKRTARQEVPAPQQQHPQHQQQQREPSTLEQDLQEDVDYRVARAKIAAKRLTQTRNLIRQIRDTVDKSKRKKHLAVSQVGLLEAAATISSAKLELAQAEASAAKAKTEGYSRPGRIVRSLMAKWDMGSQVDVDRAERHVDEATWAHTSARAKADKMWDEAHRSAMDLNATSTTLREAQEAYARASRVLIALEEKADHAVRRAAATARTIETSRRYWMETYEACGMGGKTDPASSKIVVTVEDGFTTYQEERRTKRARQ